MGGKRLAKICTEKDSIPFDQVEYDSDVLRMDHEDHYLIIDDFIDPSVTYCPKGATAM